MRFGPVPKYPLVNNYKRPNYDFITIVGPCSYESREQIAVIARELSMHAVTHFRCGVFRAGTYPPENIGMIPESEIEYIHQLAGSVGAKTLFEILDYRDEALRVYTKYADCWQIGARQMQNYTLLNIAGSSGKTVFLKRHPGSTLNEWLGAAEYLLRAGCPELYLIERGSVSHVDHVRWELSISTIAAIKQMCDIPVIVDASHGTGRRDLVEPMTLAGIAAGADGFLCEVHPNPDESVSDSQQAYQLESYGQLRGKVEQIMVII